MEDVKIEIKKKKSFLYRYRNNKLRLERLEKKLPLLEDRLTSLRATNLSGMPRGGVPVTMDDLLNDIDLLKERIRKLKIKCDEIKREIIDEIDNLEDTRYSEVLEMYFIERLSFEDISDELGYTERHIKRLYARAINKLVEISKDILTT